MLLAFSSIDKLMKHIEHEIEVLRETLGILYDIALKTEKISEISEKLGVSGLVVLPDKLSKDMRREYEAVNTKLKKLIDLYEKIRSVDYGDVKTTVIVKEKDDGIEIVAFL